MKPWHALIGSAILAVSTLAVAGPESCLTVQERSMGKNCGSRSSVAVRMQNSCNRMMVSRLCIQMTNGKANCGMNSNMKPGDTVYNMTCDGTGRYAFDACEKQDYERGRCTLVRDSEINWGNR